ncbi:hypothetical protein JVU11DRAFT_12451 [Chiua virens]|nr:hypothetical protein JVU11DRAFT_12451 [Chiua virens]
MIDYQARCFCTCKDTSVLRAGHAHRDDTIDLVSFNNPTAPWNINIVNCAGHYDGMDTFNSIPSYAVVARRDM